MHPTVRAGSLVAVLLTLTTTGPPATDLGFLLHKHPDRVQSFEVVAGQARVFYPRAEERECTAALLVEADPVELARRRRREPPGFALGAHVNDRPYAASLLAVEFARAGFAAWAERVAADFGYEVAIDGIGDVDAEVGTPTQMAVFTSGKQSEGTAA